MVVRIHLGHLEESPLALAEAAPSVLTLSEGDPIFVPIASFLASLMSFAALVETYNSDRSAPWGPDDWVVLDAASAGHRVRVAGQPLAAAIVRNHWPQTIHLELQPPSKPYDGDTQLGQLWVYLFSAVQGMFTSFYEDHKGAIEAAHGSQKHWPPGWKFGRFVRNALSHGGALEIRHPDSASWRTLTYTQSDHGRLLIFADLWPGDILLLMKDMQDELP